MKTPKPVRRLAARIASEFTRAPSNYARMKANLLKLYRNEQTGFDTFRRVNK